MLNEMKMAKFLARFCNVTGKDLYKVHHTDLKYYFPKLKRADELMDFDLLSDKQKIQLAATGQVIYVNDGRKTIPYITPEIEYTEFDEPVAFKYYGRFKVLDVTTMNVYELRQTLRRKFNSVTNQRLARRELEDRGIVLRKKYDRTKERREVERIKNEGY